MKYIVSEEELNEARYDDRISPGFSEQIKSKQPVELVVKGEAIVNPDYSTVMVGETVIADTGMTMELFNKFQELDNQIIKIYIQKIKESEDK